MEMTNAQFFIVIIAALLMGLVYLGVKNKFY